MFEESPTEQTAEGAGAAADKSSDVGSGGGGGGLSRGWFATALAIALLAAVLSVVAVFGADLGIGPALTAPAAATAGGASETARTSTEGLAAAALGRTLQTDDVAIEPGLSTATTLVVEDGPAGSAGIAASSGSEAAPMSAVVEAPAVLVGGVRIGAGMLRSALADPPPPACALVWRAPPGAPPASTPPGFTLEAGKGVLTKDGAVQALDLSGLTAAGWSFLARPFGPNPTWYAVRVAGAGPARLSIARVAGPGVRSHLVRLHAEATLLVPEGYAFRLTAANKLALSAIGVGTLTLADIGRLRLDVLALESGTEALSAPVMRLEFGMVLETSLFSSSLTSLSGPGAVCTRGEPMTFDGVKHYPVTVRGGCTWEVPAGVGAAAFELKLGFGGQRKELDRLDQAGAGQPLRLYSLALSVRPA